jgi:hypothetical protein
MEHLLRSATKVLKKSKRISALKFATVALGINSSAALTHDLTQVVTGAIGDGIVGQVLPLASTVAATSGGLCLNFITTQVAAETMSALLVVALGVMLKARGGGLTGERLDHVRGET